MSLYIKDPPNAKNNLLDTVNGFLKVAGHKINLQKSVAFLYNNDQTEKEYVKTILFTVASKIIKYLEKI
jgi:hypothetical protein